jgi:hypothetical protein
MSKICYIVMLGTRTSIVSVDAYLLWVYPQLGSGKKDFDGDNLTRETPYG